MAERVHLSGIPIPFAARPAASQALDQEVFEHVVWFVDTLLQLRGGNRLASAHDLVATACMLADVASSTEGEACRALIAQHMLRLAKRLDPYVLGAPERPQ